ncbi:alpha/beta fold hydrolase [Roseivirga sp. BDSF3-8]|uniref:alpha/beta fold hydrolase n=1 Tax=Roseivirga sp. BDSF3-8 TaxID=3241598 RepID=UPI00353253FF
MHHFFTFILSFSLFCLPGLSMAQNEEQTLLASNASLETTESVANEESRKVLSYRTQGSGPVIYLFADGPGMNSHYLDEVGKALADHGYTAVVPESKHANFSGDMEAEPISLKGYVEDIEYLRKSRGDDKIILFGHKWGGILAMAYMAEYGSHVNKVVLSGSAGTHMGYFQDYGSRMVQKVSPYERNLIGQIKDSLSNGGDPLLLGQELLRISALAQLHNKEKYASELEDRVIDITLFNEKVYSHMIRQMRTDGYDLRDDLMRFYSPVLVVQGEFDINGKQHAMNLADSFPDASLQFIEESASYPWIENPEAYYEAIAGFMK